MPPLDGSYLLIVQNHGWGSAAGGPSGRSTSARPPISGGCATGYVHLADDRYEARDIQELISDLVGGALVDAHRIGATGESYGGGITLALATLKDRIMYPDGSLHPWMIPVVNVPIWISAAAAVIPWSDLVASLVPNGATLDTAVTAPTADLQPAGVEKQSYVSGLFGLGSTSGYYAPPGTDPEADLTGWYAALNAGEPYNTPTDQSILTTIARYHSAYSLLDGAYGVSSEQPAPLLIANGFTDDLFPVDEGVRYANLEHSLYPDAPVSLYDMDFGHSRGQNKPADLAGLELLSQDAPYVRTSNGQFTVSVSALDLTLPVDAVPGAAATPAAVTRPASTCTAAPSVRITSRRLAGGHRLRLAGRAGERPCALVAASVLRGQRVRLVRVAILRAAGHRSCRYVLATGRLSRARACRRPLTLNPRGTSRWSLNLRLRVPRGVYRIGVTATDARGVRSRAAAVARIRVR